MLCYRRLTGKEHNDVKSQSTKSVFRRSLYFIIEYAKLTVATYNFLIHYSIGYEKSRKGVLTLLTGGSKPETQAQTYQKPEVVLRCGLLLSVLLVWNKSVAVFMSNLHGFKCRRC